VTVCVYVCVGVSLLVCCAFAFALPHLCHAITPHLCCNSEAALAVVVGEDEQVLATCLHQHLRPSRPHTFCVYMRACNCVCDCACVSMCACVYVYGCVHACACVYVYLLCVRVYLWYSK